MAEPAWVIRSRRTRTYPPSRLAQRRGWSRRTQGRQRVFWLARLALCLEVPFAETVAVLFMHRAIDAAYQARVMLEGGTLDESGASQARPKRFTDRVSWIWGAPLPLRLLAHFVLIALVITVVVWFRDPIIVGDYELKTPLSFDQAPLVAVDFQVERAVTVSWEDASSNESLVVPFANTASQLAKPAFVTLHRLAEGETLGELAARYGVDVASLFWANGLQNGDVLAVGQELRIPRIAGLPYVIQPGDTIESVAAKFQVGPEAIMLFKANGLANDGPLSPGREIFIPGARLPYPEEIIERYGSEQVIAEISAVEAGVVQESDTNLRNGPGREYDRRAYLSAGRRVRLLARYDRWIKVDAGLDGFGWVYADLLGLSDAAILSLQETNDFPPPPLRWVWPTYGRITSPFGWRRIPFRSFHDGLDIANGAWTPIVAAARGRVIEAGWCRGFGYCVKINHGEGIVSIYGHLIKAPPVSVGDQVSAGDRIGFMGSTYDREGGGYSTGVHLHFTIKVNGKAVDPLKFLP